MKDRQFAARLSVSIGLFVLAALPATAAPDFSFTGVFDTDDQLQLFTFTPTGTSVVLKTLSYAGGTNADGALIPAGGFDPVLSLYGPGPLLPSTPLLFSNDNGGASVLADPITLLPFDAFIDTAASLVLLTPGLTYYLVLSESPSLPLGNSFGDGFSGTGQGNYTGSIYGCATDRFCDIGVNQRNGNWAVDILGASSAQAVNTAVPEPTSLCLLISTGAFGFVCRRKRKTASRHSLTVQGSGNDEFFSHQLF